MKTAHLITATLLFSTLATAQAHENSFRATGKSIQVTDETDTELYEKALLDTQAIADRTCSGKAQRVSEIECHTNHKPAYYNGFICSADFICQNF